MFSNRILPEAPDFDENRKSIFLTCRLKIVTFCIVIEYQCDSFWVVGSHLSIVTAARSRLALCLKRYAVCRIEFIFGESE